MENTTNLTVDIDKLYRILSGTEKLLDGLTTLALAKPKSEVVKDSKRFVADYYHLISASIELLSGTMGIIADGLANLEIEVKAGEFNNGKDG